MALHWPDVDDVLLRARCEYLEMPGLRLTPAQAERLWGGVDALAARSVIQHINRRTMDNITAAGFTVDREENLMSDIVELVAAHP